MFGSVSRRKLLFLNLRGKKARSDLMYTIQKRLQLNQAGVFAFGEEVKLFSGSSYGETEQVFPPTWLSSSLEIPFMITRRRLIRMNEGNTE